MGKEDKLDALVVIMKFNTQAKLIEFICRFSHVGYVLLEAVNIALLVSLSLYLLLYIVG